MGFEDDRARDKHEKEHVQVLRCVYSGCNYDLPFRTTNALRSHITKFHAPPKTTTAPRTLRRSSHAPRPPRANLASGNKLPNANNVSDETNNYVEQFITKGVFCTVWEMCTLETGPQWIECGEGLCIGFAFIVSVLVIQILKDADRVFSAGQKQ